MAGLVPQSNTCCDPCEDPTSVAVPGSAGTNAYTTAASFTMPAELANVTVTVGNSDWMAVNQLVFVSDGTNQGIFTVISKASATSIVLQNAESTNAGIYPDNAAESTVFAADAVVSPGGNGGRNAFTVNTATFDLVTDLTNVTVTVGYNGFFVVGQVVAIQGAGSGAPATAGYYEVQSTSGTTSVVLKNLRDDANSAYGNNIDGAATPTTIAVGSQIAPGGVQGPAGDNSGALLTANNLSELTATASTARTNLGLGSSAIVDTGITDNDVVIVDDAAGLVSGEATFATATGIETKTAAESRTALGLGSLSTQAASAIAATGGSIESVTVGAVTPDTGAFTTLSSSGTQTQTGRMEQTPSSLQTLTAATTVLPNAAKIRVVGSGGPVTLVNTPTMTAGTADGQRLLIKGTHATNTVTFQDNGTLAGSNLELGSTTRVLGAFSHLELSWDATDGKWCEISFSANT